ncbi:hypothetical protein N431DRAFT_511269 [Stipitochalara longipes BDJ]|nr:hypothetical protein N431DRAFT_511269 [Stipitochalara longipes BDJ]
MQGVEFKSVIVLLCSAPTLVGQSSRSQCNTGLGQIDVRYKSRLARAIIEIENRKLQSIKHPRTKGSKRVSSCLNALRCQEYYPASGGSRLLPQAQGIPLTADYSSFDREKAVTEGSAAARKKCVVLVRFDLLHERQTRHPQSKAAPALTHGKSELTQSSHATFATLKPFRGKIIAGPHVDCGSVNGHESGSFCLFCCRPIVACISVETFRLLQLAL